MVLSCVSQLVIFVQYLHVNKVFVSPPPCRGVGMKPQSWLRRNWLWAAGGAFVTIHLATWLMQRAMKSAVRSEAALKQNAAEDKLD